MNFETLDWYSQHDAALIPAWWVENGKCACGSPDCKSPGKHPIGKLVPHGLRDATKDVSRWNEWLVQFPHANFAMATGSVSGVDVLDSDSEEAEKEIIARGIPASPTVRTGKGYHHYFAHHEGARNWTRKVGAADFRGDGGYVMVAGCSHISGKTYEWVLGTESFALPPQPQWLRDLHAARTSASPVLVTSTTSDPEVILKRIELGSAEGPVLARVLSTTRGEPHSHELNLLLCWECYKAGASAELTAGWLEWPTNEVEATYRLYREQGPYRYNVRALFKTDPFLIHAHEALRPQDVHDETPSLPPPPSRSSVSRWWSRIGR